MSLLPIFLKLDGRRCLLVGAGTVALGKIGTLLKSGVRIRIVAPEAHPEVQRLAIEGKLIWTAREFQPEDLDGNSLVIAATNSHEINSAVYRGAVERNILCNSVDDIPNCDFFFGAAVSRGDLQIAISTGGKSPSFAQQLRGEIEEELPEDLGPWLDKIGELRREILATHPAGEKRRVLLHQLAQRQMCDSPTCSTRMLAKTGAQPGHVYLVGAGPGDPDLLTVKALHLIQSADVILHDDLVPETILSLAHTGTEIVPVGKRCGVKLVTQGEINALMIRHARTDRSVVRLKGGDPLLFGRASEEMAALIKENVPFEIIPGITAAFAAAAAAGCSLTSRNNASSVILTTGHHAQSRTMRLEEATRVVYMPGRNLSTLAQELLNEGLPPELPCAIVSRAMQPDQHVRCTVLATLGDATHDAAPSLLIAGWAVSESRYMADATANCIPATA